MQVARFQALCIHTCCPSFFQFSCKSVFLVAVCLRWCKVLKSVPGVQPQLYVDNFKCDHFRVLLGCLQFRLCLLTFVVSFVCLRPCMSLPHCMALKPLSLLRMRTAFVRAVLSGALTLATPGAVPSLLEGLVGWTLAIMWSGSCVDIWPESRMCMSHIYGLLGVVSAGTPRHVPFTVLFLVLPLSWASLAF